MTVLLFLAVLVVIIVAHEFGHFIVAKLSKMRVDEFGIGFPPKIWGIKKGETEYTLNALPFGGFVKIHGEDPNEDGEYDPDKERNFSSRPKILQAAVLFAGVFFNVLLAWILISIGFMSGLPTSVSQAGDASLIKDPSLVITAVLPHSPADLSGVKVGDKILSLESGEETLLSPTPESMRSFISSYGENEMEIFLQRGEEEIFITIAPTEGIIEEQRAIGVGLDIVGVLQLPPHKAIWQGGVMTIGLLDAVVRGFGNLIKQAFTGEAKLASLTGPVGIAGLVGDASDFGFVYLLSFIAFISINLAVINLIPFPALDGGRLLFLAIESIKGSPINPRIANSLNVLGFLLLIGLMIVVTYHDIVRIFVN